MKSCNRKELEFSVFIINKLAEHTGKSVVEIYEILTETEVLDNYIIECYDVLHTLGSEYLMEDIIEVLKDRGVTLW